MASRLQHDFLGPFVECNGTVNRPGAKTELNLGDGKLAIKHVRYTPQFRVRDAAGNEETWYSCGEATVYHEAKATLPREQFERWAAMACAPEFAYSGVARELYPAMAKLVPATVLDYLGVEWKAHSGLTEQLKAASVAMRQEAYLAKHGGKLPAPAGPAPVALKAFTVAEVLARMGTQQAYRYVQLPSGNQGEFAQLQDEMARRGVRLEFSDLRAKSGDAIGRIYRIRVEDLHLLPTDEQGPYFGEYQFRDKGAGEVMDIYNLGCRLEKMPAADAARVLRSVAHSGPDEDFRQSFSCRAAGEVVIGLQEWEELFEQPGIDELLNYDLPELLPGDEPVVEQGATKRRKAKP